ncbi:MAG: MFS transporter [Rubrivivax sp.]|nr:MFS transporter [Rubrivivax sp.]
MPPLLYLLALGNLVVGSAAFVITGLIELMAQGLDASLAEAGQAVTAFALSTALLSPLVLVATGGWTRRWALVFALVLVAAGNAVCAAAASLPWLYAGRVLMGMGSMFTPIVAGVALALVPPAQQGRALSATFLGVSLSYVVGVPLGTWIGLTQGWQASLWAMTAASALVAALVAWRVPAGLQSPRLSFSGLGTVLRQWRVVSVLLVTALFFTSIFTVVSYVAPLLSGLGPGGDDHLALALLVFGVAGVAGTLIGGWGMDRLGRRRTLTLLLLTLASTMVLLPLMPGHLAWTMAALVAWGITGFGVMAPQQACLARMAPGQAPLLISVNASMLYIGMAVGAAVGGPAAERWGIHWLPWVAAPFAGLAWLVLLSEQRAPATPLATGPRTPN